MNAKQEFLEAVKDNGDVKCAILYKTNGWDDENKTTYALRKGYSEEDYNTFLSLIDFEYDAGFGGQELFGNVWFTNKTWLDRSGYDGSEWWALRKAPKIPKALKKEN